jgi:hypothetical protein
MSATGTRRSLIFTPQPPAADVRETREADRAAEKIATDPQEAVLLYGHMLTDADVIQAELRGLMFSGADYRSRLRVVRAAARRLEERAAKLLGENSAL